MPRRADRPATPPAARPAVVAGVALALVVAVFALYGQVAGHQYVSIDDDTYITANRAIARGLTGESVRWALTATYAANWHPLTWLSHELDVTLFGMDPRGPHLVGVALHAANAVLLFLALLRMTGGLGASAFVASAFAVHPLRVESVAWVAERKDLLSGLFFMLMLLAYARYAERPGRRRFALVAGCLALGLLAKPMLVTAPFVLLLLDLWPLGRLEREGASRLMVEKVPLLALSVASSAATVYAQHTGGAVSTFESIPLGARCANALVSYVVYLRRAVWPMDLGVYYPHAAAVSADGLKALLVPAIGSAALLALATAWVVRQRRSRPYLAVGWGWYVGMLVPVIGIVQVGMQAMADRYAYLPLIGISIAVAWGAADLAAARPAWRQGIVVAGSVFVVYCAVLARQQIATWRDDMTLYTQALKVTSQNPIAHNNLGVAYARKGDLLSATAEFETALAIRADYETHDNLGMAYLNLGRLDDAEAQFREALRLRPNAPEAIYTLGVLFDRRGDLDGAIAQFQRAIALRPDYVDVINDLGVVYAKQRKWDEAASMFRRVLALDPNSADARDNLQRVETLRSARPT